MYPTLEFFEKSIIISFLFIIVSFVFAIYGIYLNWKQARVKNQMEELLIVMKEIRDILKRDPLFGHTTGKSGNTKWFCFMKIPN